MSIRRDDGGIYIEEIQTKDCKFKKPGANNSDLFHKENCLIIQTQIRALQELETKFQTTDLGKILEPKFILAGSIAEGTKVGSIANELDVTMKFEVKIKIILELFFGTTVSSKKGLEKFKVSDDCFNLKFFGESMEKFLPKKEGTRNVFDYIKFLEIILNDLKNVLSNLSMKFKDEFNLTMGLNNRER